MQTAAMREQAVQVIVDDGLGLLGRGVAGEDARAQARGHGQQAEVAIVPGSHGGFNRDR
jgi:hypothetical protein